MKTKEEFIEMCKDQFVSWETVEHNINKLLKKKAIKLENVTDYKEVYAVMDAIYRKETWGYTNGSSYPECNTAQKRKSTAYLRRLTSTY